MALEILNQHRATVKPTAAQRNLLLDTDYVTPQYSDTGDVSGWEADIGTALGCLEGDDSGAAQEVRDTLAQLKVQRFTTIYWS